MAPSLLPSPSLPAANPKRDAPPVTGALNVTWHRQGSAPLTESAQVPGERLAWPGQLSGLARSSTRGSGKETRGEWGRGERGARRGGDADADGRAGGALGAPSRCPPELPGAPRVPRSARARVGAAGEVVCPALLRLPGRDRGRAHGRARPQLQPLPRAAAAGCRRATAGTTREPRNQFGRSWERSGAQRAAAGEGRAGAGRGQAGSHCGDAAATWTRSLPGAPGQPPCAMKR